jgi:hypothetical protein
MVSPDYQMGMVSPDYPDYHAPITIALLLFAVRANMLGPTRGSSWGREHERDEEQEGLPPHARVDPLPLGSYSRAEAHRQKWLRAGRGGRRSAADGANWYNTGCENRARAGHGERRMTPA